MSKNQEVYAKVTAQIVAALEAGTVPWIKPWIGGSQRNALSLRPYSGINVLVTAMTAALRGYETSGWVTFKQALELGCVVRKGEKGTTVMYMSRVAKRKSVKDAKTTAKSAKEDESYFMARAFTVFNLDQLSDLDGKEGALERAKARVNVRFDHDPIAACEEIVAKSGALINHSAANEACYLPTLDEIRMPLRESFRSAERYYGTLFHEMGHWTGHESRLKRDLRNRFGSEAYAVEELVAELTAAYLSHRFGFEVVSQSAAYLASWLRAIQSNPSVLVAAASAASKAADFLAPDPFVAVEEEEEVAA